MTSKNDTIVRLTTYWGSRKIEYQLHRERRRDLLVAVHPDLRVEVRAPDDRPIDHVQRRVDAHRSWIARQLRDFEQFLPLPPPRFLSGETLLYLGREYRLKIEGSGRGVSREGGRLIVRVPSRATARVVRESVLRWYRSEADRVLRRRAAQVQDGVSMLSSVDLRLRVRRMARRWGSCSASGIITMNPALIQAPLPCVDYVLVHELVHLLEPAHSARFYGLLGRAMPDWRERRERLAKAAVRWCDESSNDRAPNELATNGTVRS